MAPENGKGKFWVGFDLGGTKMLASVFDADFRRLTATRKKTKAREGGASGVKRIIELIHETLDEARVAPEQLGGIGVGVPGPLDLKKGVILQLPNLGWTDVPLRKKLEEEFRCAAILANDVDVGTYGEYRFGAGRGARCVLGVFPGTGIGGACIYEGRILRGTNRSCLEIGHIRVMRGGAVCGCGRRGCLETVASRLAIAAQAAVAVFRGEAPNLGEIAGTDIAQIRSGALAEAIRRGDKVIEGILRNAASALGSGIASVVNLLAPDVIVLGGGLVEAFPDLYRKECGRAIESEIMASFHDTYRLAVAELGDYAGVTGAAALAATPDALGSF